MKIQFVDLKTQYYSIKDKIDQAILSVIQDSAFTPQAMEEAEEKLKHSQRKQNWLLFFDKICLKHIILFSVT